MSWKRIIGQERVKELLRRALKSRQVAHAYLFYGSAGIGKDAAAIEFARALNCEKGLDDACGECPSCKKVDSLHHPNIQFICALLVGKGEEKGDDPLGKLTDEQIESFHEQLRQKAENPYHRISIPKATFIKINSIREIKRQSSLSMFEGGKKVFIISNAEDMNAEASNSLLKTLEEPASNTVLILTTSQRDKLLPTILSRCQLVQFDPIDEADLSEHLIAREGIEPEQAALVAKLAEGSYDRAMDLLSVEIKAERESVVQFMRAALSSKPSLIFTEIEKLGAGTDRTALERALRMLQLWLREALVLRERGQSGNGHEYEDARRFIDRFPNANLPSALESVETSIALLNKNVYIPLILTNLAYELKKSSVSEQLA
ncbi:MAG: DNA polymerase III subunit delta' [Ignavibacteriae bacterium]|nr:DNA polymerase III subunit delta' [Ignavibacteriota bacterium]